MGRNWNVNEKKHGRNFKKQTGKELGINRERILKGTAKELIMNLMKHKGNVLIDNFKIISPDYLNQSNSLLSPSSYRFFKFVTDFLSIGA